VRCDDGTRPVRDVHNLIRGADPRPGAWTTIDGEEVGRLTLPYGETATLRLAYAISVHKAQGCEVPVVIGVCHRSHARMLTRPLLYTAVTRARRSCVLVGDRAALEIAIRRDDSGERHSALAERLRG